jgi:hypothetical protein
MIATVRVRFVDAEGDVVGVRSVGFEGCPSGVVADMDGGVNFR